MPDPDVKPGKSEWEDSDWRDLLLAIKYKRCTPFLGAGACYGVLPLGRDLAQKWAKEYHYPFEDSHNLVRVAQFIATQNSMTPKLLIAQEFEGKQPPDFSKPNEIHRLVADLELPVYITTNYDNFLTRALERPNPRRVPKQEFCRWHLARAGKPLKKMKLSPSSDQPVVFHLHGILSELESMVLTEDDYLDFLMCISKVEELIPARIDEAFSSSTLLFLGYSLEDMNFKVLFRKLASFVHLNKGARHVSVQLEPAKGESHAQQLERAANQKKYLQEHLKLQQVKIYWGNCEQFASELRPRWEAFKIGQ